MADRRREDRSRSPPRRGRGGRGGFRWKDTSRSNNDRDDRGERGGRKEYRDRSPPRYRDSDRFDQRRERDNRDRPGDNDRNDGPREERRPRSPGGMSRDHHATAETEKPRKEKREKKDKKEKKAAAAIPAGQEMIIVNVNDRLGTKSAIPCLPADTVGQLKLMVAARIGREPGQIMLKRQGERPFKDHITLEDYGISNGVQLDLEVDTGD
ncbi:putative ubiquitin-like protein [Emericellopsis atlantica]|uniref:Ubiquitin-like modifier HUB1 n=1 Tax=Emericellopsis atlantica TaxID=2614577 RepID=A0A9P7ZT34_9HYPO|nr:putative ubiquitin-like protein [Emericellopsis atlantica]KAG9257317.1 putative ubiquitin-like protein [Emericellopsis atlantica]